MKYNIKYTEEELKKAIKNSISIAEVLRNLKLPISGGYHSHVSKRIKLFNIDTSHFLGQAWNKGGKIENGPEKLTAEKILVYDRNKGRRENISRLKRALKEKHIEEKCVCCGLNKTWNGKILTLQVNHKDGNFLNNKIENLEYLCPNCHSQTETFGTKNINNGRVVNGE